MDKLKLRIITLVVIVAAICATLGITLPSALDSLWSNDGPTLEQPVQRQSVASHVSQMEGPVVEKTHAGERDESDINEAERAAAQVDAKEQTSGSDKYREPAGATFSQRGCVTTEVQNQSSRNGARPSMFFLHYTVSANRTGTSDVWAIRNYFNSSRAQASSNYVIDFEGNCLYIVSENRKAWTQGAFNPWAISIEFIATGNESTRSWKTAGLKGLKKGARVAADAAKRWGIPIRFTDPSGCTVIAGITDHNNAECGNNHHDVRPNFPIPYFMRLVAAAKAEGTVTRVTRYALRHRYRDGSATYLGRKRIGYYGPAGVYMRKVLRDARVRQVVYVKKVRRQVGIRYVVRVRSGDETVRQIGRYRLRFFRNHSAAFRYRLGTLKVGQAIESKKLRVEAS